MSHYQLYNRVGNGRLSLRRVNSFKNVCLKSVDELSYFKQQQDHLYNEDVFFALIPENFVYPTVEEALKFSFDTKPDLCYKHSGRKIPFGCHGISYPAIYEFWKDFISDDNDAI